MRRLQAALLAAVLLLSACASTHGPPPAAGPAASSPPVPPPAVVAFGDLPGWAQEDHAAALTAFRTTCGAARDAVIAGVCARARALSPVTEPAARQFLETHFRPVALAGDGLLTAYFAPEYEARDRADAEFSAPVRPRPADLPAEPADGDYPDRAAIETRPADDALAWMRPEDLFFLQIQGSGFLTFPDGQRRKAVYVGHNGRRFSGIAAAMRQQGLLADANTSGDAIHAWLAGHRGAEAEAIMRLNPRYVFFRLDPDDGGQPAGAAGLPLPPGRAIAVDLTRHPLGELYWLDARAPALSGAFPAYQRLAVSLDTGGAIRGEVRADLYTGRGPQAGAEAGRVRHVLRLYRLDPVSTAP